MRFDENSGIVRLWIRRIRNHGATLHDVPDIYNLREVVASVMVRG